MSWDSMIVSNDLILRFLNRNLPNSLENFVRVVRAEERTDPTDGNYRLLIEICLKQSDDPFEYTGFEVLNQVSKYLKLISIYDVPHIKIVNE